MWRIFDIFPIGRRQHAVHSVIQIDLLSSVSRPGGRSLPLSIEATAIDAPHSAQKTSATRRIPRPLKKISMPALPSDRSDYYAGSMKPPSTMRIWPRIISAPGEQRNDTAAATSSGSTIRPAGLARPAATISSLFGK